MLLEQINLENKYNRITVNLDKSYKYYAKLMRNKYNVCGLIYYFKMECKDYFNKKKLRYYLLIKDKYFTVGIHN